jgi:hypothetical protein
MTDLVAIISSGRGTIGHVAKVIDGETWEKIYIITFPEFKNEIPKKENTEVIVLNREKMLIEMVEEIKTTLKGKLRMMDTAVNFISGEGKEHMALLSALLQLGIGIRLVALTKEGVKVI